MFAYSYSCSMALPLFHLTFLAAFRGVGSIQAPSTANLDKVALVASVLHKRESLLADSVHENASDAVPLARPSHSRRPGLRTDAIMGERADHRPKHASAWLVSSVAAREIHADASANKSMHGPLVVPHGAKPRGSGLEEASRAAANGTRQAIASRPARQEESQQPVIAMTQAASETVQAVARQASSVVAATAVQMRLRLEDQLREIQTLTQCLASDQYGIVGCGVDVCSCGMLEACYPLVRQLGNASHSGRPALTNIGVCDYKPVVLFMMSIGLMGLAFIVFSMIKVCARGTTSAHLYLCILRSCPSLLPLDWPPPKSLFLDS
eukprot:TRINITY_DN112908_c0_g1_i1.p1 TRINITY_DN112908_c0_g1~~TRINITY_DN112908_c0_g1_i1.p1  ORF type:complete len:323 (+),score=37.68 TRINITY_DN112908_c0_g1_i1:106-1074(+)